MPIQSYPNIVVCPGGNCYVRIPEYFERPEHLEFEKKDKATQARLMRNASRQVKRNKGMEVSSDEEEPVELSDRYSSYCA